MNELAFHFYTSPNHAHHRQLYVRAYGTETERLERTVRRRLDGAERKENVTIFLTATVGYNHSGGSTESSDRNRVEILLRHSFLVWAILGSSFQ